MIELTIDGRKVSVPEGTIVLEAANRLNIPIPHFCYHKKLSLAANCRMCLVEIEKVPKPMPACANRLCTMGSRVWECVWKPDASRTSTSLPCNKAAEASSEEVSIARIMAIPHFTATGP